MAEIRIEEKKSTPILPWIIGLLLLALVVWGVAEVFDEADEETYTETVIDEDDDDVAAVGAGVAVDDDNDMADGMIDGDYVTARTAYLDYTADMEGEMGLDHEFSHRALTLLAGAATALADAKDVEDVTNADSKAARVQQLADEITRDPLANDHADKIRMSALLIVEMLEDVDQKSYGATNRMALDGLRKEAQDINAQTLALNQKEDVRSFFRAARSLMERMN